MIFMTVLGGTVHPESGLARLLSIFPWSLSTETHEKYTCKLCASGVKEAGPTALMLEMA